MYNIRENKNIPKEDCKVGPVSRTINKKVLI